ncbi:MAG: hypothetical protein JKY93_07380 [Gammaproteobacteria bacterium]|nr:hypothetical protein [Gammaproteobacteria bacterium]
MLKITQLTFLIFCCIASLNVLADEKNRSNLRLSFFLDRTHSDWNIQGQITESRISRYGVSLFEPLNEYVSIGIMAGALDLQQTSNPTSSAFNPSGHFLGFLYATQLPFSAGFSFDIVGEYSLYALDATHSNTEKLDIDWTYASVGIGLGFHNPYLRIKIMASQSILDGDETRRGSIHQNRSFELAKDNGYKLEAAYFTDQTGEIGLHLESGANNTLGLDFTRYY